MHVLRSQQEMTSLKKEAEEGTPNKFGLQVECKRKQKSGSEWISWMKDRENRWPGGEPMMKMNMEL
jgi:hypothetical protein